MKIKILEAYDGFTILYGENFDCKCKGDCNCRKAVWFHCEKNLEKLVDVFKDLGFDNVTYEEEC